MDNRKEKLKWKERLRKAFAGMPVFWQYFSLLAIVLALACGVLLLSNARYSRLLSATYFQQAERNFQQNCNALGDMLFEAYSVPVVVEHSENYGKLQQIAASQLPETGKPLVMEGLRTSLTETLAVVDTEAEVCFLYYPQYDVLCTRERSFGQAAEGFAAHLQIQGKTPEEICLWLKEPGTVRLSQKMNVTVDGVSFSGVILLLRPAESNGVLGLVYSEEQILQQFNMPAMPKNTFFRMTDAQGNVLAQVGTPDGVDRHRFTGTVRGVDCCVELGIPKAYFTELTTPNQWFGILLLGLTLLLGLALCAVFSDFGASPLQNLLSSYDLDGNDDSRNEINRLADILASSRMESAAVNLILSKSVLVRVLSGGVLTEEEEQSLLRNYPILEAPCRIAIVHTTAAVEEFGQSAITELVAEHLPESFVCATISGLETGVLLPDDPDALSELAKVLAGINDQLKLDGLIVLCGVSAPFVGAHSAYAAVRQARFSVPIRESSYIEVYSAEETGDERPGVFSWLTHERLYQAVMKNDRTDTVEFIRTLAADKYYSAADAKEVFYNVRFVVRSTANEMQLPLPEADVLEYREEMRPKENFRNLEELACILFDRLHARTETNANNTMENVVAYVMENFRNPELSATMVATHFSLPVKAIYAAVREKTDKNMGDFVIELRMKEAARLLCTTQKSVDEIAVECGYPAQSTFYRVFKKYFGESPNKYRSLH